MDTGHGNILVVDDNLLNRKLLERALNEQGHTVVTAENGLQALERLRAGRTVEVPLSSPEFPGVPGTRGDGLRLREFRGTQGNSLHLEELTFDIVLLDILMPEMDGYETLAQIKGDPALRHIPVIMISGLDEIDSVVRCIEMGAEDYLSKPYNPLLLKARLSASLEKKKLRDLERAYLQQEMMLRQSEKLATLGRLSAGMAHELNNPAAAAQSGIGQMRQAISQLQRAFFSLGRASLSPSQVYALQSLAHLVKDRASQPVGLDPLGRSEREAEVESWLDNRRVERAWEYAPALVCLCFGQQELAALERDFNADQLPALIAWLNALYNIENLLDEVGQGAKRISEIVDSLKSYSFMDQAPVQPVDLHESLDSTLALLSGRIQGAIHVRKAYAPELPRIMAYGSELNQVWTHLLENCLDELKEKGEIILRTRQDGDWVVVEVEDNGPGIPKAIQSKIFDPFFSTKPPGIGIGLGLSISHNIVVQKHAGKIQVRSRPGKTVFEVWLPIQ